MKKILKVVFSVFILVLGFYKINAKEIEFTYSDWSLLYPSGLDEVFIQSEVRYHFYKVENNLIVYDDEYHTNLDGYIRDDASARTFYRYYTNNLLIFDSRNNLVTNDTYCQKNYCYFKLFVEPTMVDLNEKELNDNKYENQEMFELKSEVVPKTLDNIHIYVISFIFSLVLIICLCVKKSKKVSYE